jgi:hypothetical protein
VSIVAQTLTTLQELEIVRGDWRALWRRAAATTVFQSPDWLVAWWRHFAPGQLTCIALRRGEELVGIAPLYHEEGSRRLLPLGISLSDCLDLLLPEENGDVVRLAMQAEIAGAADTNEICFPDVAPDASVLGLDLKRSSKTSHRRNSFSALPTIRSKTSLPISARTCARRKIGPAAAAAPFTRLSPMSYRDSFPPSCSFTQDGSGNSVIRTSIKTCA